MSFQKLLLIILHLVSLPSMVNSFQMPRIFGFPNSKSTPPSKVPMSSQVMSLTSQLLKEISGTENGKSATSEKQASVLRIVRQLELKYPPSLKLLSDPKEAEMIDGTWYLQYTSPSEIEGMVDDDLSKSEWKPLDPKEGDSNIETGKFKAKGSVSASGIEVDTSNRVVKQIIDAAEKRVTNEIMLDWGQVVVGGTFRLSTTVPNRAVVKFNTANITPNNLPTLKLGFVFDFINFIRQSKENGWLETTFIDENIRIGRGNKGTLFVLTRKADAVDT